MKILQNPEKSNKVIELKKIHKLAPCTKWIREARPGLVIHGWMNGQQDVCTKKNQKETDYRSIED